MIIKLSKSRVLDPDIAIRRCGYGLKQDRRTGAKSYTRHFERGMLYPRFHVYIKDGGDSWVYNLHLDQRATVYEGATAHSGDYEGETVEKEAERIKAVVEKENINDDKKTDYYA